MTKKRQFSDYLAVVKCATTNRYFDKENYDCCPACGDDLKASPVRHQDHLRVVMGKWEYDKDKRIGFVEKSDLPKSGE